MAKSNYDGNSIAVLEGLEAVVRNGVSIRRKLELPDFLQAGIWPLPCRRISIVERAELPTVWSNIVPGLIFRFFFIQ